MTRPQVLPTPGLSDDAAAPTETLARRHAEAFDARFGAGDDVRLFLSPGRVNLFGGHLDYNGGPVLPTAIDRGTFIALRRRSDDEVRLASVFGDATFEGSLDRLPSERTGSWFDYPLGVVRGLHGRGLTEGFDILYGGNLPVGAGLSSSASICVGTAYALDQSFALGLSVADRVDVALDAERGFVGVQCGIMDPYAVGFARPGHVLWLDCKDRSFEHLPLDFDRLSIGVVDSGVQRALARGEFNRRVSECAEAFRILAPKVEGADVLRDITREQLDEHEHLLPDVVRRRARHVVDEVARTFDARDAFLSGDLERLGRTMTATHRSFQTNYECSCEELDVLVDAAVESPGVIGARLTGAGFGGCVVVLVAAGREEEATGGIVRAFEARYGKRPPVAFFQGDEGPRGIDR